MRSGHSLISTLGLLGLILSGCQTSAATVSPTEAPPTPVPTETSPPAIPTETPQPEPTLVNCDAVPDVIFHSGTVVTMDPDQPEAQAAAVTDNLIAAVGSDKEVLGLTDESCATRLIDLQGRTLMPGFVDPHTHLLNDSVGHYGLSLIEVQDLAFENGITTIGDPFITEDFLHELEALDARGDLRLRSSLYLIYTTNCGEIVGDWYTAYPVTDTPGEKLRVAGIKIFLDGGSCGMAAMSQEFVFGEGLGDLWLTQDQLNTAVDAANQRGYQVLMHAMGDRAVEQAQNALEYALGGGPNLLRHRIDHNFVVRPDLMARYSEVDAVTVIWLYHEVCTLKPANAFRQSTDAHWRDLLDANPGLMIAWHGDDPWWGPVSPILELHSVVTRQEVDPQTGEICTAPDWLAAQALTVDEVLPMLTINAAYALGSEDEVGSITPGKFADLIVLSENPRAVPPEAIRDIQVWMTMVDGRTEFCAPGREAFCP